MKEIKNSVFPTITEFHDFNVCGIDTMENALLEYVILLANHFFPDVQVVDTPEYASFSPSLAPREFKSAYNKHKLNHTFTVEDYVNNTNIQGFLKEMKLDRIKFWYLLVFVYNYCYNRYMIGIKVSNASSKEQLNEAIKYLNDNLYTDDDLILTIGKKGKEPKVKVTNKFAIRELINWKAYLNTEIKMVYMEEQVKESANKFAYHFDKYMSWFLVQKQDTAQVENMKKGMGRKIIFFVEHLLDFMGVKKLDEMVTKTPKGNRPEKIALIGWMNGIRKSYKDSNDDVISPDMVF